MVMADRFYCPNVTEHDLATLDGPEAHHLLHVMRAKVGDTLALFDGQGHEYAATIQSVSRSQVQVLAGPQQLVSRESPAQLTMAVALPKGDRQKWLVEKLTELGVATLVPLTTQRSVADLRGKSLEKLERVVVEACKQCGRNQLMQIAPPQAFTEFVAQQSSETRVIAHPSGSPWSETPLATSLSVTAAIGPEGGFADDEVDLAIEHGWKCLQLGSSILRIETAAVVIASLCTLRGS